MDVDLIWANAIAVTARNGVEDLHTRGAFSDRQTSALNRALRNHVYTALYLWRRANPARPRGRAHA